MNLLQKSLARSINKMDNTIMLGNKIKTSTLNGAWKITLLDCIYDFTRFLQAESQHQIQKNLMALTNDVVFEEYNR